MTYRRQEVHATCDFIESELIVAPIMEAGGAETLMFCHLLRQIRSSRRSTDLRLAKRVTADFGFDAGGVGPLHHCAKPPSFLCIIMSFTIESCFREARGVDFSYHVHYSGHMDIKEALAAFDSLSQDTRLRVFRLLVEYGSSGVPAGTLSESLHIPHNTLSFHLKHMSHAGLVLSQRDGKSIIYTANFEFFSDLIRYMVEDCCRAEFASIRDDKKRKCSVIELSHCCETKEKIS
jgi:ArsR family transcriptional regulator, arsenate/arsenite/antimonite-responsive transcriptional repressor